MGRGEETRLQILELATKRIRVWGFCSLSYRQLAQDLNVTTTSIHYYFPSKTDLGVAVVQGYLDGLTAKAERLAESEGSVLDKLRLCFDMDEGAEAGGGRCLLGMLQAESSTYPPIMRKSVALLGRCHREVVRRLLQQGLDTGELEFPGNPLDQATVVVGAIQGALQLADVLQEPALVERCVAQLEVGLKRR